MNNPLPFGDWLRMLQSKFEVSEEYALAAEIFPFAEAYKDGLSPQQAYEHFDNWVAADAIH